MNRCIVSRQAFEKSSWWPCVRGFVRPHGKVEDFLE